MYDVVFVLGGMQRKNADGSWRTTHFNEEGDDYGVLGDYLRPKAAAILSKKNPSLRIITVGGGGQLKDNPEAPAIAQIMKNELIELGVPCKTIEEETECGNSYEQLIACVKSVQDRIPKHISILSNEYHLPRLYAMGKHFPELKKLQYAKFVSAESVLIEHDQKTWKDFINKAYASEKMKVRTALEQQGVKDIIKGRYRLYKDTE